MQRIQTVDELFHEGNPSTGTKGTKVTEDWLNNIQEEIANVIEGTGTALSGASQGQLLKAIQVLAGLVPEAIRTLAASGPVLTSDRIILLDGSASDVDLTLLSAAAANAKTIEVIRIDDSANQVRLLPKGAETIAWEASVELNYKGEGYRYIPDGVDNYLQRS